MEQDRLMDLLKDMSLEEKIDQMLQVSGMFYEKEGVITGPSNTAGYTKEEISQAGSVLGSAGAEKLKKIQKEYMEKQPHHIPLMFMADIINGFRTVFPIPLAQGCSFHPELVEEGAAIAAKESAAAGLHLTFSPMGKCHVIHRGGSIFKRVPRQGHGEGLSGKRKAERERENSGLYQTFCRLRRTDGRPGL